MIVYEELSEEIIGAAIEVHKALGPGLLESAYRICMMHELRLRGIEAQLLTYLRLTGMRVGLLINFNSSLIKNSIIRRVI